MKTRLTLRPGQNGTKKLLRKYGGRLLAVRYRYDEARRLRLKTVELVEDQLPWVPRVPADSDPAEPVLVRIGVEEASLRQAVKDAGGKWHHERKLWELPLGVTYALGLDQRIVR
jgi:alpha-D-ribose 1-methylphosphonate 5-triphosphate synthase subunit PhnL